MGLWDELRCREADTNAVQRGLARLVASRPGAAVASRVLSPVDSAVRRATRGRTTASEALTSLPTITVTTTGARSGLPRHTHLLAIPHHGDIAVIGSNFGGPRTPAWVHNLRSDTHAEVSHLGRTARAVARPLAGDAAAEVWEQGSRMYAGYAAYRERAAHREITVWLLEPEPT